MEIRGIETITKQLVKIDLKLNKYQWYENQKRFKKVEQNVFVESAETEPLKVSDLVIIYKANKVSSLRKAVQDFERKENYKYFRYGCDYDKDKCIQELLGYTDSLQTYLEPLTKLLTLLYNHGIKYSINSKYVIHEKESTKLILKKTTEKDLGKDLAFNLLLTYPIERSIKIYGKEVSDKYSEYLNDFVYEKGKLEKALCKDYPELKRYFWEQLPSEIREISSYKRYKSFY